MENSKFFEREINLIQSEDYRMFVRYYLDNYVAKYFWEIGASSSGKYHPSFSQGLGGLVRHTKAVVMFAEELLRMSSYMYMSDEHKDFVIMACILHDTCKYGQVMYDKDDYKDHAKMRLLMCVMLGMTTSMGFSPLNFSFRLSVAIWGSGASERTDLSPILTAVFIWLT